MSSPQREKQKEELPFESDSDVESLVVRFETCSLPYKHWTHRAHLAVAVRYLRQFPFDEALSRLRDNITKYNRRCGDPDGYNETITVAFLKKLESEFRLGRSCSSMHGEVERLKRLCTVDWLYNYYSRDLIWSQEAKRHFKEPDLARFDF